LGDGDRKETRVDVNGTRYHLLYGCDDWGSCSLVGDDRSLGARWRDDHDYPALEWDCDSRSVRLAREVPLFRSRKSAPPLDPRVRRGAGRDSFGNWYWIDQDEDGILFQAQGAYSAQSFWGAADELPSPAARQPDTGAFEPCPKPSTRLLRGLAVTTHDYLVVGDVTDRGLLIFDLYGGGNPTLLRWPPDIDFIPWDLAATPGGGVLILDRDHSVYWALDANLRLQADVASDDFQADCGISGGSQGSGTHKTFSPRGHPLTNGSPSEPIAAISIETGPCGHALILEMQITLPYSTIYEYDGANQVASYSLEQAVEVMDPLQGEGIPERYSVVGHDFTYFESGDASSTCGCNGNGGGSAADQLDACGCPLNPSKARQHIIYVADHLGKQSFAFLMDRTEQSLRDMRAYLPMRAWDGKAIVTAITPVSDPQQVYYNFVKPGSGAPGDRWVPLMIFAECHYIGLATLTTPANFDTDAYGEPVVAGMPFDSNIVGCTWHRLLLDAQIPPGTAITLRARASDDPTLLSLVSWSDQPPPHLRSGRAELPYYYPWKDLPAPLPDGTGTWELLFQEIQGRYIQLELTLQGPGRATPAMRALRAWYPRFSYLDNYLPVLYRQAPVPASFFDRWLANFEGFYTNLEDLIENSAELFDPRTAPAETLAWLACWLGLVLDPLWDEDRRRIIIRHVERLYRLRGTVVGIEIAVRLYVDTSIDDSLFDLSTLGKGSVQIIERYSTRGPGAMAYGPPTSTGDRPLIPLTSQIVADNAHRFIVQVPYDLTDDQLAMVRRIVDLEKPAHTAYDLLRSSESFSIGTARFGLETRIGQNRQYEPMRLGGAYLAETYLDIPFPYTIPDRLVRNRDYQ
jgi:phage tail-like protein